MTGTMLLGFAAVAVRVGAFLVIDTFSADVVRRVREPPCRKPPAPSAGR